MSQTNYFIVLFFLVILAGGIFAFLANKILKAEQALPVISQKAVLVTKRTKVDGVGGATSTYYFCTFELLTSERLEFRVSGAEYGQLKEGDRGQLVTKGERYCRFERETS